MKERFSKRDVEYMRYEIYCSLDDRTWDVDALDDIEVIDIYTSIFIDEDQDYAYEYEW